jgi:hypothetical protein
VPVVRQKLHLSSCADFRSQLSNQDCIGIPRKVVDAQGQIKEIDENHHGPVVGLVGIEGGVVSG